MPTYRAAIAAFFTKGEQGALPPALVAVLDEHMPGELEAYPMAKVVKENLLPESFDRLLAELMLAHGPNEFTHCQVFHFNSGLRVACVSLRKPQALTIGDVDSDSLMLLRRSAMIGPSC